MDSKTAHIEVILPVLNEVKNILPLLKQFDQVAHALGSQARLTYLFVNDGSTDGTKQLLHRLFREREDLRILDFVHNFGHNSALAAGMDYFDADVALVMDADLQDDPKSLLHMFAAWQKGAKTVVAERGQRDEKMNGAFKAFYYLLHQTAPSLPSFNFGTHCLLDRTVVERLRLVREKHRYFPGLVSYVSKDIQHIRFDRADRANGNSRVGWLGRAKLAATALTSFSSAPVRLVAIVGTSCAAAAFAGGVYIIGVKLFTERAIPGWASTMTAIAFASSIQLLCLGVLGEYVARIYDEVKQRPLYLIDRMLEKKAGSRRTNTRGVA